MCPNVIFQNLLPHSRPYDVTSCDTSCDCDVTCLFIVQKKENENEIPIKSENKRKRKNKNCSCSKCPITQRVAEKEKKKKRTLEYLQQLQDEMLEEEAALLKGTEGSQVVRSKHKKVATRDEEVQWPSKKARGKQPGKYYGGTVVKMGMLTPVRGV